MSGALKSSISCNRKKCRTNRAFPGAGRPFKLSHRGKHRSQGADQEPDSHSEFSRVPLWREDKSSRRIIHQSGLWYFSGLWCEGLASRLEETRQRSSPGQCHPFSEACWWHHAEGCSSAAVSGRPLVRTEGKMNVGVYRDYLDGNWLQSALDRRLAQWFIVQQDNNNEHTAKI